ncbi:unnamed protein product, partial [Meganyctiphanes norvegica]
ISKVDANTPELYHAIDEGNLEDLKRLTDDGKNCTSINDPTNGYHWLNGESPIHTAVRRKQTQIVSFMLSCDADPNTRDWPQENTPLIYASQNLGVGMVNILMTANPEINAQSPSGYTALMGASQKNHLAVVKILMKAGAEINLKTTSNWTALMYAARYASVNMTSALLDYGADMNIQDENGRTALHLAAESNRTENFKTLINRGADVRMQSNNGETAGAIAMQTGYMDIIIIERGTDEHNKGIDMNIRVNELAKSAHSMFVIGICLDVTFAIAMIITCVYFRYKLQKYKIRVQNSPPRHAVIFSNENNEQNVHIYEN